MSRVGSSLVAGVALSAAVLVAVLGSLSAEDAVPVAPPPAPIRIGVYDSRAIAVAARDGLVKSQIDDLVKQRKEAVAAGDTKRVAALESRGANIQKLRHLQAFSNGPVDDIMNSIAAELPAIAKETGVVAIAARTDFVAESAEAVDITDAIVKALHPDEKTLKVVADLRSRKPLDIVDVLEGKE